MKRSFIGLIALGMIILLFGQTESFVVIYDDGFDGEITANGDVFSQDALTAAHEFLPLGTRVELLYVQTGKRISLLVNDRIYDAPDLFWISRSAADSLGIYSIHPTSVLYTVMEGASAEPTPVYTELFRSLGPNLELPAADPRNPVLLSERKDPSAAKLYGVQVYAAAKRMDAVTLSRRVQEEFEYLGYVEKTSADPGTLYRVIIGDFDSLQGALECYWKLRPDIPEIFLVEK